MYDFNRNIQLNTEKYINNGTNRHNEKLKSVQGKLQGNPYYPQHHPQQYIQPKTTSQENAYQNLFKNPQKYSFDPQSNFQSASQFKKQVKPSRFKDEHHKQKYIDSNETQINSRKKDQGKGGRGFTNFIKGIMRNNIGTSNDIKNNKNIEISNQNSIKNNYTKPQINGNGKNLRLDIDQINENMDSTTKKDGQTPSLKTQFIPLQSPYILVQPRHCLQFVCTPFQTSAVMRIFIHQQADPTSVFRFNIRATNRQDYKVTESSGQLQATQAKIIYFYLKQSAPLNKNLKDKFLLQIFEGKRNGRQQKVYQKKFAILIESALHSKNPNELPPYSNPSASLSNSNSMSKFLSVYKSSNGLAQDAHENLNKIYVNRTEFRETVTPGLNSTGSPKNLLANINSMKHIVGRDDLRINSPKTPLITLNNGQFINDENRQSYKNNKSQSRDLSNYNQQVQQPPNEQNGKVSRLPAHIANTFAMYDPDRLQKMHMYEQDLKTELNQTIQGIQRMKRKILLLENQNKSTKARARFRIYITIVIVVLAFFFGIFIKNLHIQQRVYSNLEQAKRKISEWWVSDKNKVTHNEHLAEEAVLLPHQSIELNKGTL